MKNFEKFATKPSSARRKFLKGAGIAAATGTAAIALAACDDKPKKEAKKADKIASPQVSKAKTQVLKVKFVSFAGSLKCCDCSSTVENLYL